MTTLLFALRPHTTSSACAIKPRWSELSSNLQTDGVCGCPVFFPRLHPHTRCGSVIGGCCRGHATGGFFVGEASEEGGCRGHAADWHCWTWMGVLRYVCAPLEGSRRKVPPSSRKDFVAKCILGRTATALIATACIRKTMRKRVEPLLRPQTCVRTPSARRHETDELC